MDIKDFEKKIDVAGQAILLACENYTTTFPEAVLAGKIKIALNFQSTDTLYFSLLDVQKIIDANHDRECLRLRKLIKGYIDKVLNFDKEV